MGLLGLLMLGYLPGKSRVARLVVGATLRPIRLELRAGGRQLTAMRSTRLLEILVDRPAGGIARALQAPTLLLHRIGDGDVLLPLTWNLEALRLERFDQARAIADRTLLDCQVDVEVQHLPWVLLEVTVAGSKRRSALVVRLWR